ncbi:hypothetical protein BH24CHL1_BH24CHL1_14890 [soil metagenome]
MTGRNDPRALPIRRWLALALFTVFVVPLCVTAVFAVAWVRQEPHDARSDAVQLLREDAQQWNDPVWRTETAAELARDDVAFVLTDDGQEIYRSTADPFAGNRLRVVEKVVVAGAETETAVFVYANERIGPPEEVPVRFLPFVGLAALALTLGGIAWFMRRTVINPLSATSAAARQIAAGDLDVQLPTSRVREVAEVNTAFELMSAELRSSLQHQTELEQERRLFIGAIVHDLRTPLFSLRGYLEGFEKGLADTPEKRARYIAVAQEKADALERLISDLFDFTRLEYLEQPPNREPLDLRLLLGRLAESLRPQADAKGVILTLKDASNPCAVDADSHLLTRVMENLLDNALRHTPNGGSVNVECHVEPGRVAFSIADTGPGIPELDLPHLFTPLFRGETSRNRRTGGAGLGLTIARRILLAHGGDITAGNGPGGGAVFIGWLPAGAHPDR